jgi:NCS1 family nucleobase:cation symporter-1
VSLIESRHLDRVPESEWHGRAWRQGPFWFLGNFQPITLALAFLGPVLGLNGLWTSIAGITGILFGAMFMAAHAAQGPTLGLPQMIQSRAQFGYSGVVVPVTATTLTFVGFNVVTLVVIKQGLFDIFHWSSVAVAVIVTLVAASLAIFGHDRIHAVVLGVFWGSLPLWILVTGGVLFGRAGGSGPVGGGFNAVGFFAMFSVAASYNITYAPCVSDYSRYLARDTPRRHVTTAVFLGAVGSPIWLIPLGAWMATRLHTTDALGAINATGNSTLWHLGTALALASVAALVAAMGISAYSGMLSIITIMDSIRPIHSGSRVRILTIVALAAVWLGVALAYTNATTVLNDWLIVMLYLLAPWTSINLIDFYFVRHGRFAVRDLFTPSGVYGRWGLRGLAAYSLGIAVEIPLMAIPNVYQSPGATSLDGVDISWIVGLVVAGAAYLFSTRHLDHQREARAIALSDEALASERALR